MTRIIVALALLAGAGVVFLLPAQGPQKSPIHFHHQALPFTLENSETPQKHLPETMAGGVAVLDFDQDGRPDIYLTNGASMPGLRKTSGKYSNRLLRNDGHGGFVDVTAKAGVAGAGFDIGVTAGDYDNNGYPDLFVAGVDRNILYRNNGDGTFSDVTDRAGFNKTDPEFGRLWSVAAAWLDYDNDGRLDLFVVNYCRWDPRKESPCLVDGKPDYCHPKLYQGLPNSLYHNNGDGTFTDVSAESGIRRHVGKGMSAAVADYDNDGRPDIFVANDKEFNFLFHNEGGGKFAEKAFEAGVAATEDGNPVSGMGVDFRDLNNDGRPDLFFTALPDETFPLFLNRGKGWFEESTHASRLSVTSRAMAGWSAGMFDFDNDGWKDIFVARGEVLSAGGGRAARARQPNTVFRNSPSGVLEDLTGPAGLTAISARMHRGAAFGDFNGDGRVDAVVTALGSEAELWLNDSPPGAHWIELKLAGSRSNRDGAGAGVRLVTKSGEQWNHATSSVGYASSSAGPLHFGLGVESVVRLVEIHWPSGQIQRLENVKADRVLKVSEPD